MLQVFYCCILNHLPNDSYNQNQIFIKSCRSFQTFALISSKTIECQKRIKGVRLNQNKIIKDDYVGIISYLQQWSSRVKDEELMCEKCRQLHTQQNGFKDHIIDIQEELQYFDKLRDLPLKRFNQWLKLTFLEVFWEVYYNCHNADIIKIEFQTIKGHHGTKIMKIIDEELKYVPNIRRTVQLKLQWKSE